MSLSSLERVDLLAQLEQRYGLELDEASFAKVATSQELQAWVDQSRNVLNFHLLFSLCRELRELCGKRRPEKESTLQTEAGGSKTDCNIVLLLTRLYVAAQLCQTRSVPVRSVPQAL